MKIRMTIGFYLAVALILTTANASPQKRMKKPARNPQTGLTGQVATAKEDVVAAANAYMESLIKILVFQENDVKTAEETLERRRNLVESKIVSDRELEESQRQLASAKARVEETKRQMRDAANLIEEAKAEKQLALMPPPPVPTRKKPKPVKKTTVRKKAKCKGCIYA
jgi:multidrug resistance efflux pump